MDYPGEIPLRYVLISLLVMGLFSATCALASGQEIFPDGRIVPKASNLSEDDLARFFARLNLDYPGLEAVKELVSRGDYGSAAGEFIGYMRQRESPAYFFDHADRPGLVEIFSEKYPNSNASYVSSADEAMLHVYTFGGETRDLGADIDWVQDDDTWTADLNGFSWIIDLGRAYWLTGNGSYSAEYVSLLNDWIGDNPRPAEPTTDSGEPWRTLDTGIRMERWIEAYQYFMDSPEFTAMDQIMFLDSVAEQSDYLYAHILEYRPYNWAIIESSALSQSGIMYPEFRNASLWRNQSFSVLSDHFTDEIYVDGAYIEVTPGYHQWVAEAYLRSLRLSDINGFDPGIDTSRYKGLYDWIRDIQTPSRTTPKLGDAGESSVEDFLSIGAYLYNDPYLKHLSADVLPEEFLWIFGMEAFDDYASIVPEEPEYGSVLLPDSQYIMMRTGWGKAGDYLLFDCAPYGSAHSHTDALDVVTYSNGAEIFTDPGICDYDDPLVRYYKIGRAHNIIVVDGIDVYRPPLHDKPLVGAWRTSRDLDYATCSYPLQSGQNHSRTVYFIKPDYWIISDLIEGGAYESLEMLYHPTSGDYYPLVDSLDGLAKEYRTEEIPDGSAYSSIDGSPYLSYVETGELPLVRSTVLKTPRWNHSIASTVLNVTMDESLVEPAEAFGYRIDYSKDTGEVPISIKAAATYCYDWPDLILRVNGILSGEWTVNNSAYSYYNASVEASPGTMEIDLIYPNGLIRRWDCIKELYIEYVNVSGAIVYPTDSQVIYDRGYDETAYDGVKVYPGDDTMIYDGALRFNVSVDVDVNETSYSDYLLMSHAAPATRDYGGILFDGKTAFVRESGGPVTKAVLVNASHIILDSFNATWDSGILHIYSATETLDFTLCDRQVSKAYLNNAATPYAVDGDCIRVSAGGSDTTSMTTSTTSTTVPPRTTSTSSTVESTTTFQATTTTTEVSSTTIYASTTSTTSVTSTTLGVLGDADGDGRVDYSDLLILAYSYGACSGEEGFDSRADYDTDGYVGYDDLLVLAQYYGTS